MGAGIYNFWQNYKKLYREKSNFSLLRWKKPVRENICVKMRERKKVTWKKKDKNHSYYTNQVRLFDIQISSIYSADLQVLPSKRFQYESHNLPMLAFCTRYIELYDTFVFCLLCYKFDYFIKTYLYIN